MNPNRSGRAWLPAVVLSVVFAVTLIALQLIFHFGYDDDVDPLSTGDSVLEWLFVNNLGFWGPGAFDPDETRVVISNLSAGGTLLVLVFVLTWLALRGTAPGSSALPAFFSGWFATMVAAPVAALVSFLIRTSDQGDLLLGPAINSASYAGVYGLKWGWPAALVATLVWMSIRPRPSTTPSTSPDTAPETPPATSPETPSTTPPPTGTYPQPPS